MDVEARTRAFIGTLGKLSPRYEILAAQAITLARELDDETTPASAKPSLNRQLTINLDRIREAEPARPKTTEQPEDEVERARRARQKRLAAQGE